MFPDLAGSRPAATSARRTGRAADSRTCRRTIWRSSRTADASEVVSFEAVRLPAQAVGNRALAAEASAGRRAATNDRAKRSTARCRRARPRRARPGFTARGRRSSRCWSTSRRATRWPCSANGGTRPYQVEFTEGSVWRRARSRRAHVLHGRPGRLLPMLTRLAEALRPVAGRRGSRRPRRREGDSGDRWKLDVVQAKTGPGCAGRPDGRPAGQRRRHDSTRSMHVDIDEIDSREAVEARAGQVAAGAGRHLRPPRPSRKPPGLQAAMRTNTFEAGVARMFTENASYVSSRIAATLPRTEVSPHRRALPTGRRGSCGLVGSPIAEVPVVSGAISCASRIGFQAAPVQTGGLPLRIFTVSGMPSKSGRTEHRASGRRGRRCGAGERREPAGEGARHGPDGPGACEPISSQAACEVGCRTREPGG